jgi:hypothetical protein
MSHDSMPGLRGRSPLVGPQARHQAQGALVGAERRHQVMSLVYRSRSGERLTYHPEQECGYLHATPTHDGHILDGKTIFAMLAYNMADWAMETQS